MEGISLSTIKSMATMMGVKFPVAEAPANLVSEFIDKEIDVLLPPNADPELVGILKGVYVNLTNRDPNSVLQTLVKIHADIGELVRTLQTEQFIDEHPPVEIDGPEGEPELDDTIDPGESKSIEEYADETEE